MRRICFCLSIVLLAGCASAPNNVAGTPRMTVKDYELRELLSEPSKARALYDVALAKLETFTSRLETNSAPELQEALLKDQIYLENRRLVDELDAAFRDFVAAQGSNHNKTKVIQHRLDTARRKGADIEDEIRARTAALILGNLENDATSARAAEGRIDRRIKEIRDGIARSATSRH